MIIDCISDLHGHYPQLEGGDLLIVAGDLTARDVWQEYEAFDLWIQKQDYKKKIVIGGNHDNFIQATGWAKDSPYFTYLCDSGTEFTFEDDDIELEMCGIHPTVETTLKIWGSPWTLSFPKMNPNCKAFTVDTEEELAEKWALIPNDTDILITHSPPYGILDSCYKTAWDGKNIHRIYRHVGSESLYDISMSLKPRLHVFGHIHASHGVFKVTDHRFLVNASIMNDKYEPSNKPIRIEL